MSDNLFLNSEKKPLGYETLVSAKLGKNSLLGIIAIHNTNLGPALGGCRMFPYKSKENAIFDVLRLSRGMTHKAAVAGLPLGGGKAVIIGDPSKDKSPSLWHDFGKMIQLLAGKYITAEDVGTSLEDMVEVKKETKYVTGLPEEKGGNGDPSPVTANGVYWGIKASLKYVFGNEKIKNKKFAIQGLGKVGFSLAELLAKDEGRPYVADIDNEKVEKCEKEFSAIPMDIEEIYSAPVDVFSPSALGAIINQETIPNLKCKIIAGPANNQLADENRDAKLLEDSQILYAPDFAINSGGLINVAGEVLGYNKNQAIKRSKKVYHILLKIYNMAKERKITTAKAAIKLAEERINNY